MKILVNVFINYTKNVAASSVFKFEDTRIEPSWKQTFNAAHFICILLYGCCCCCVLALRRPIPLPPSLGYFKNVETKKNETQRKYTS